jgi:hypothetical protein
MHYLQTCVAPPGLQVIGDEFVNRSASAVFEVPSKCAERVELRHVSRRLALAGFGAEGFSHGDVAGWLSMTLSDRTRKA